MKNFLVIASMLTGFSAIACDCGHENLPRQSTSREQSPERFRRVPPLPGIPRTKRSNDLINLPPVTPSTSPTTHKRKTSGDQVIIVAPDHWTQSPEVKKRG